MNDAPYGLPAETVHKILVVFAEFPEIEEAKIYGSRAKGNYKEGSDIDLTLFGANLSQKLLNRICIELDDLLLPYSVDLSIFNTITNSDLVDHILRVGKTFYGR